MSNSGGVKWNWPAAGESTPPYSVEALFGPVARNDDIVLTFSPSTYTGQLTLYCAWQDGQQGIVWNITGVNGSPHTYTFNETTPDGDDLNDNHICHFFSPGDTSPGGSGGNTQTFKYLDTPSKQSVLWQQSGSSPKAQTSDGASTSANPTSSPSSTPSSTVPSLPLETKSSNSPAISTGTAVGITIGAVAFLVALGVLAFFLRRRRRRQRTQQQPQQISGPGPMQGFNEHYNDKPGPPSYGAPPPQRGYSTKRVGELEGQQRVEMDGGRHSGPVIRSELPGS